jgi:hypothetical protein
VVAALLRRKPFHPNGNAFSTARQFAPLNFSCAFDHSTGSPCLLYPPRPHCFSFAGRERAYEGMRRAEVPEE